MRWLTNRTLGLAGLGLLAIGLMQPAQAQIDSREGIALQNQIYQLRQELQQLRDQGPRGGGSASSVRPSYPTAPSNDLVTQLLTRVDSLEEQVRQLRGQLDETQHQQQTQAADLGKRIDDLAFQVSPQGAPGSVAAPSAPPSAPNLSPPPVPLGSAPPAPAAVPGGPTRRTPELAIQEGNNALGRRDYTTAEQAAREVLTNARTSPRAYDAQFLLAQAMAGQRQFPQAAIAYDDAYNRNRKGAHAPDALVGLATSLTALNEKKAACDTLVKLGAEFPQLRPDLRDPVAATRQRAGCK